MDETQQKTIVVAAYPQIPLAADEAKKITLALRKCGVDAIHGFMDDPEIQKMVQESAVTFFIALGGDGTMLRAGRLCAPYQVPILGINMGRFGFLTEIQAGKWQGAIQRLIDEDYWIESRMMLQAEHFQGDSLHGSWDVLNEVVVGRGHIVRPVHLTTEVDGRFLTTYVADGVITATPTGSTAYALAAGGPILPPQIRNILLVPVAPHLSVDHSIVLAEGSSVRIRVKTDHHAVLCIDGQEPIQLQDEDYIDISAGKFSALFVRFQDPDYFYRNLMSHMNQNPFTENNR